jgi:hypothetical protein
LIERSGGWMIGPGESSRSTPQSEWWSLC